MLLRAMRAATVPADVITYSSVTGLFRSYYRKMLYWPRHRLFQNSSCTWQDKIIVRLPPAVPSCYPHLTLISVFVTSMCVMYVYLAFITRPGSRDLDIAGGGGGRVLRMGLPLLFMYRPSHYPHYQRPLQRVKTFSDLPYL